VDLRKRLDGPLLFSRRGFLGGALVTASGWGRPERIARPRGGARSGRTQIKLAWSAAVAAEPGSRNCFASMAANEMHAVADYFRRWPSRQAMLWASARRGGSPACRRTAD